MSHDERTWTVSELSREWEVSTSIIYKWIREGELRARQVGITQKKVVSQKDKEEFESRRMGGGHEFSDSAPLLVAA